MAGKPRAAGGSEVAFLRGDSAAEGCGVADQASEGGSMIEHTHYIQEVLCVCVCKHLFTAECARASW